MTIQISFTFPIKQDIDQKIIDQWKGEQDIIELESITIKDGMITIIPSTKCISTSIKELDFRLQKSFENYIITNE